jgi:hypothetical protein
VKGGGGQGPTADRKVDLARVIGSDPEALEFALLKTDKEGAVKAATRDASKAGDIAPAVLVVWGVTSSGS